MARRPEQHAAETVARKAVVNALPAAWEPRDLTGRDYGIDLQVELFTDGEATGRALLLQIKAFSDVTASENGDWLVDVDVQLLRYAELFAVPLLLAAVHPIEQGAGFRYLWLQEYIRVVLDVEKPAWRDHKATVRLRVPHSNTMPGVEDRLSWIAGAPQRLRGAVRAARIQHEVRKRAAEQIENLEVANRLSVGELGRVLLLLMEARSDPGFFGDSAWVWAQTIARNGLDPAIAACRELLEGLGQPGGASAPPVQVDCAIDGARARVAAVEALRLAERAGDQISAALSIFDDARLAYGVWTIFGEGSH
jgi:hypothetical protein